MKKTVGAVLATVLTLLIATVAGTAGLLQQATHAAPYTLPSALTV